MASGLRDRGAPTTLGWDLPLLLQQARRVPLQTPGLALPPSSKALLPGQALAGPACWMHSLTIT